MKSDQGFRKSEVEDNPLLGDGIFALGVMTGLVIAIIIYLSGHIWGSLLTKTELIEIVPAIAAFMVALVSLLISLRALIEQKKMRQAGVDPVLIAHLTQDPYHPLIITLNISNVGAGAATNVFAKIDRKLGDRPNTMLKGIDDSDFFNGQQPIAVVLQGQSIPQWLGPGHSLLGKDPLQEFSVELTYEDIEGSKYKSIHYMDLREFDGRTADDPAQTKIVKELQKISEELSNLR